MPKSFKRTLLVTGGAGFIGSCFVAKRIAAGDQVIVLDALTYAGHTENLSFIKAKKDQLVLVVDSICNQPRVRELLKRYQVTAVVNFAAESHVDNSIASPADFIETNISGTYHLLEASRAYFESLPAARKKLFRYLQVSTDEVYGELGATGKFTETTPLAPNSPYSASKASADLLVRAWHHTYGLPTITTNCTNNYGPRQHPEKLIPRMIECALAEEKLPVYGKGTNIRDWIFVEDHCDGIALALEKGAAGETYCFGGKSEKNNLEVVKMICTILDRKSPRKHKKSYAELISFVTDRKGHDFRYAIDDSKARRDLGYLTLTNFEKRLEETIDWYIENPAWRKAAIEHAKKARANAVKKAA
jgi:dTDP-glucose 4,6-dehydratase